RDDRREGSAGHGGGGDLSRRHPTRAGAPGLDANTGHDGPPGQRSSDDTVGVPVGGPRAWGTMARLERLSARPSAAPGAGTTTSDRRRQLLGAVAAGVLTIGAICALFLFPSLFRHYRYPLGWDAPATVRR